MSETRKVVLEVEWTRLGRGIGWMRAFIRLVVEYLAFLRATGKDEPVDFKMESVGSITVKKGE